MFMKTENGSRLNKMGYISHHSDGSMSEPTQDQLERVN